MLLTSNRAQDYILYMVNKVMTSGGVTMTQLEKMEAIQEAHEILLDKRRKLADGTTAVWNKVDHALKYLDKEMSEAL